MAEVYALNGQKISSDINTLEIYAPKKGIYLVSIVDKNNLKKVEKIIIQ